MFLVNIFDVERSCLWTLVMTCRRHRWKWLCLPHPPFFTFFSGVKWIIWHQGGALRVSRVLFELALLRIRNCFLIILVTLVVSHISRLKCIKFLVHCQVQSNKNDNFNRRTMATQWPLDFQKSPSSDFIWRGTTKDDLSRLRRFLGLFAA